MLNILDLQDAEMSAAAKSKRMFDDIESRFNAPLVTAQLATLAATSIRRTDPERARQVIRDMGGEDDGKS